MNITYIHHSGFLVETQGCYYLFDYETGQLPELKETKPVFVLSSHGHGDHYNPEVFALLAAAGAKQVRAVLSEDIAPPEQVDTLRVTPGKTYVLGPEQVLTTFDSTDLGVAFLLEDRGEWIYHAGDLNDWVWDEETEADNRQMTGRYRREIDRLAEKMGDTQIDAAFVVLDPRQEQDYHRGMCYFLDHVAAKKVYPMHYWDQSGIIHTFLREYPQYAQKVQKTQ